MFFKKIHKRIKIVLLVILFCFLLIICKVFYIQVIDYEKLNNLANALWSRNLPIESERGKILTSDGVTIADNLTTTSLVLIPNQIKEDKKEIVAKDLSKILGVSYEEMYKHVNKKTSIERVHPEGRRLDYKIADKINALNYDGVYLVKEAKRYYKYANFLSHCLGYVGIDNQGLSGLELTYDEYLTGESGAIKYYSNAKGEKLELSEVYVKPQNGMDMELTINYDIQNSIERELDNIITKYKADNALILAMDPNSGAILGMGSRPDFDPNNYQSYTTSQINRNLPIWMTYEPGSTFKIITLAASIEEKIVDVFKDTYNDTGSVNVEGARLKCWKHGGHGSQTYLEVVENSCNPGFVNLGLKLGKDTLFSYIKKLGFGKKTGIDLNGESSGILFNINKVGLLELATTAFGQGISVTPIQQVTAVSAIINGGTLYKPYIVKSFKEPETNEVIKEVSKTIISKNVISKQTSQTVRHALESVVANGTGRNAFIDGYRVGGKTGTAQKVKNGVYMVGNYILSFIGFLPADDPKIVVYVAIDNPKGVVQYGGTVSAPVAKAVMQDAINTLKIEKRNDGMEKEYQWFDKKYKTIPTVIGLTKKQAQKLLKDFQIEYTGIGSKIISTSPEQGKRILEGSKLRILLGD